MGYIFISWSIVLMYTLFCVQFNYRLQFSYRLYSFPKLPKSLCFSQTPFSEIVSYIYNAVRMFHHILYSIWDFPNIPQYFFFKFAYIQVHSLCLKFNESESVSHSVVSNSFKSCLTQTLKFSRFLQEHSVIQLQSQFHTE